MSKADRKTVCEPLLAHAEHATETTRDAVVAALQKVSAAPLLCAMLRSNFVKQHDQGVWDAIACVLWGHLTTLRRADGKGAPPAANTRAETSLGGWIRFLASSAGPTPSVERKAPPQRVTSSRIQKAALKFH